MSEQKVGRRRRSSSLLYQEPPETIEHMSDQAALPNLNANWVNAKGQKFPNSILYDVAIGAHVQYIISTWDMKYIDLPNANCFIQQVPGQYIWF